MKITQIAEKINLNQVMDISVDNTVRRVYCLKYVFCDITSNQLKLQ